MSFTTKTPFGAGDVSKWTGGVSPATANLALDQLASRTTAVEAYRTPNVQTVTSAATVTPTFSNDLVEVTAQAAALALANPTGTAINGLGIVIRIKDNGTARAISWDTQYRAGPTALPTTTVLGKWLYIGMIYNSTGPFWDVVSVAQFP